MQWLAESLRFTLFFLGDFKSQQISWEKIVGSSPDESISRKAPLLVRESGKLPDSEFSLTLDLQPGRVDLYLNAYTDPQTLPPAPPFIDNFSKALDAFTPFVKALVIDTADTYRVALGAILHRPVESKEDGYKTLQGYLPQVQIDVTDSSEFIYGINRPRTIKLEGREYKINRISKWSANSLNFLQLNGDRPSDPVAQMTTIYHLARLELDISSSAENSEVLDSEISYKLFETFKQYAEEVCLKGDTK